MRDNRSGTSLAGPPPADVPAAATDSVPTAWWTLAALSLTTVLPALGTSIANVALPTLAQAFDAAFQDVQWIVLAYLLATTALVVSAGRLGDLVGRRRLLLAGIGLFTAASVLCGVAPTLWLLIAARAVQGVGAAVLMALGMALVGEVVPKTQTGRAMGLLGTMSAIGTALGPTLGGTLIASAGWQAIFLINVPLGLATLALAVRYLPADRSREQAARGAFDHLGTLLLAATLTAYALAMTLGRGTIGALNAALLLAALVGVGCFVVAEMRAASPLIRLAVFRNLPLSTGFALSALVTTVLMTTLVVGPFYLAHGLRLPTALVGLVMSVGPVVVALAASPAGRLVDRVGPHRLTVGGLLGIGTGAVGLAVVPFAAGVVGYVVPIVFITVGYALFQTANNTAVMQDVPADRRGVMSGILNLSRNLGLITGASVMGAVFALGSGASDITAASPEAVAAGLHTAFAVAGMVTVAALVLAVAAQVAARRQSSASLTPATDVPSGPALSPQSQRA